ncbi:MAG: hypothetical protein H0T92_04635 [Pyrinomonadaceae bacterium]|nr:hypothetical protein [Pyrinomonadaceae bacterium]
MNKIVLCFVVAVSVAVMTVDVAAQRAKGRSIRRRSATAANATQMQRLPAYSLSGIMTNNRIATRTDNDQPGFDYVVTGAQVVDGKLQLQGVISSAGRTDTTPVAAVLAGTMARARNPWPSAASAPERRTRQASAAAGTPPAGSPQPGQPPSGEAGADLGQLAQTAQSTQTPTPTPTSPRGGRPAAGEVTEQTQSLYTATDTGTGCELMFLKMQLPTQLAAAARSKQSVQLGVVLAPMDNQRGEQINGHVCRIVRALDAKQDGKSLQASVNQLNQMLAGSK